MRINRNARRSARPVFRSVNSSRRCMVNSGRTNGRRVLNSARSLEILSFDELNDAQKDYVVKHALESSLGESIWQWFDESLMEQYHYDVEELAKQYEERLDSEYNLIDFKIHTDALYWEESSQGPYPKWNFEKVFDSFTVTEDGSIDVEFNGGGLDVDKAAYFDVYRQDEAGEWQYDEYGDAPDASYKASEIIAVLQEFINKVWSLVNDVCQAYPDDDYIYEDLEANDFGDFVVISETEAKPVRV